jgi:predicted ester cyclase
MTKADLSDIYRNYIGGLNKQDWPNLGRFVHEDVCRDGQRIELSGYREMLEGDLRAIQTSIVILVCDPPLLVSRRKFDCRPKGVLFGLPENWTPIKGTKE